MLRASGPGRLQISLLLLCVAGCGFGSARKHPAEIEVERLSREIAALTGTLEQRQAEVAQLRHQIQSLQALPEGARKNPYAVAKVKIGRYTNFYDKDNDGRREKLIVYIQPIDKEGDTVKIAGTVNIQLWNLDNPSGRALLGEWTVEPVELQKVWFDALASGYRLMFDRPAELDVLAEPLTVKTAFTDYLFGETFSDQYVIDPTRE